MTHRFFMAILSIVVLTGLAFGQALLERYQPGPRLIDGSQLNLMVDRINNGVITATYVMNTTPAATDAVFFVASRSMKVIACSEVHSVAAGGTSTLQVVKDTSTDAPGAGTDLLTTAFNLASTANTVQTGALTGTVATVTLAAGNRLSVDYANAVQSSAGVVVTCMLTPLS